MGLAQDELRRDVIEQQEPLNQRGMVRRRLRIVDTPVCDYLRWELSVLTIRAEYCEQIRVASPELVKPYDTDGEPIVLVVRVI